MPTISTTNFRKAIVENETGTNGGVMSHEEFIEMPDLSLEEKTNGVTHKRKIFAHPIFTGEGIEVNPNFPSLWVGIGDDNNEINSISSYMQPVSETSTQADWTTPARAYGCANIIGDINAGSTTVPITLKQNTMPIFLAGDKVCIYKLTKVVSPSNSISYTKDYDKKIYTIDSISGATITLTEPLQKSFVNGANDSLNLVSLYKYENIKATIDGVVVTSAAGLFNNAVISLNGQEAMSETYTLAFSTPTAGNIIGARFGALGSFNLASPISPSNPDHPSTRLFTIPTSAFSGTFAGGDNIVFAVHAASVAMAITRVTLPNTEALRDNFSPLAILEYG